jgi:hypothetical protein
MADEVDEFVGFICGVFDAVVPNDWNFSVFRCVVKDMGYWLECI